MAFTVVLTPDEVHLAASHGLLRRHQKLRGQRQDRIQKERSNWDNEIEGCGAELAWAKHREQYWTGVAGLRAPDGSDVEIRWTKWASGGLIVYPHDCDDSIFVLARGFAPRYEFVGWMRGIDAKKIGKQTDFGQLVAPEDLHPIPGMAA